MSIAGTSGAGGMSRYERMRSSRDIRSESRLSVLHALQASGTSTRNELARITGLSIATVATIVKELLAERLLVEAGVDARATGRPTTVLRIDGDRGRLLGIDLAETYVRAVVFDAALTELDAVEVPLDESEAAVGPVLEGVVAAVDAVTARLGVDRSTILAAGISVPGLVRRRDGAPAGVVPLWAHRNSDLIDRLRGGIGAPLVVDNPLKAVARAELWFGRGRTASSMVIVNLGTGVGAGIVLGGDLLQGFTNSAGEWGHSLLELDGRECRCGRRGCVEAYVGVPGIRATLAEIAPAHPLIDVHERELIDGLLATRETDPAAADTLQRTARYLGSALADLAAVINPEKLILTGWTAWTLGELLLPATRDALVARAPRGSIDADDLIISDVRRDSVTIGVATLAFERFLGDVGLPTSRLPLAL